MRIRRRIAVPYKLSTRCIDNLREDYCSRGVGHNAQLHHVGHNALLHHVGHNALFHHVGHNASGKGFSAENPYDSNYEMFPTENPNNGGLKGFSAENPYEESAHKPDIIVMFSANQYTGIR